MRQHYTHPHEYLKQIQSQFPEYKTLKDFLIQALEKQGGKGIIRLSQNILKDTGIHIPKTTINRILKK